MVATSYGARTLPTPTQPTLTPVRQQLVIDWGQVLAGMFAGGIITILLVYGVIPAIAETGAAKIRKKK